MGNLEILRRLAVGGMSELYLARSGPGATPVVLKRARRDADPRVDGLLRSEAALTLPLQHPNLVRTLTLLEIAGRPCLALELVEGESLTSLLRALGGGPLSVELAVHLTLSVARGLAHAHAAAPAVVHGDVTASNILVGADGSVKLADFGIAEPAGSRRPDGELRGKPGYVAPEVVAGAAADPRSDIFQLGLLLMELLRGAPLFPAEDEQAALEALMRFHPRSLEAPARVPAALWAVALRMLEPDPDKRAASAAQLAAELEPFAAGADQALVAAIFRVAFPDWRSPAEPRRGRASPPPPPREEASEWIEAELRRARINVLADDRLHLSDAELAELPVAASVLARVPRTWAERLGVLPIAGSKGVLLVAMSEAEPARLMSTLRSVSGCSHVRGVLASPGAIRAAIARHYDAAGFRREPLLHF